MGLFAGQALAGATMYALMADYRIATSDSVFSLPEVTVSLSSTARESWIVQAQLGLHFPHYITQMAKDVLGHRNAERRCTTGRTFFLGSF